MVCLALLALGGCGGGDGEEPLLVGAVEDSAKSGDPAAEVALAKAAGLRALAFSAVWRARLEEPPPGELAALRRATEAAADAGIRPIVAVYQFSGDTPLTPAARRTFAAYASSIPRELPQVRDVIVGNEPNLNLFWLPQFGPDGEDAAAASYLALLAESYDALKEVDEHVNVIGGALAPRGQDDPSAARQTHSPTAFIRDLGAAYRASGRTRPVMDMFDLHPYGTNSSELVIAHPRTTTIGLADHGKLVRLLGEAFDGTPQPGSELPVVYGEYGIETTVDAQPAPYAGTEPPSIRPVEPALQGERYAEAIRFARCSHGVRMLLLFHVSDERQLERLQSGLYYADDVPKPSRDIVRRAILARTQC